MKSYREIADSVFARRDAYIIEQRRKKQVIARTTVSVGSVALVSLAGFALFKNDAFHDAPLISVSDTTTTVTNTPTKIGDTTTAGDATAPTTDSGIVTPTNPTTTDAVPSRPTATTPSKTEPVQTTTPTNPTATQTKPTAPTEPEKVVIRADKADDPGISNNAVMSVKEKYISSLLKEMMSQYKDEDVVYAVIVSMPYMREYTDYFWNSNEEWVQLLKETDEVRDAWREEAKLVNPSWNGSLAKEIEIWTDTMRANYEQYQTLLDMQRNIKDEYYPSFKRMMLEQKFEALKAVSSTEPVDMYFGGTICISNTFYAELTADAINALAEQGGYTFRLATYEDNELINA